MDLLRPLALTLLLSLLAAGCTSGPPAAPQPSDPPAALLDEDLTGRWVPGEADAVVRVAEVTRVPTPRGAEIHVVPEGAVRGCPALHGNPADPPAPGAAFGTTLRFRPSTFNGGPAVSAPELACPFPGLFLETSMLLDHSAHGRGGHLRLVAAGADGWATFEVVSHFGDTVPLADAEPEISTWPTMETPADSAQAWLDEATRVFDQVLVYRDPDVVPAGLDRRVVDLDGDGRFGDGDLVLVRFPTAPDAYRLYLVVPNGCMWGCAVGAKLVLVGPEGPMERLPEWLLLRVRWAEPPSGGAAVVRFGVPVGEPKPFGEYGIQTERLGHPTAPSEPLREGVIQLSAGTAEFLDDGDGRLGDGDRLRLEGLPEGSFELAVKHAPTDSISWLSWDP